MAILEKFMPAALKIASVVLLLYSCIASIWHPLVPGGLEVSIDKLHPGNNEFAFTGYNTHFENQKENLRIFVSSDSNYYCTEIIRIENNSKAWVRVTMPDTLPNEALSFYANNNEDGTIYIPAPVVAEGFVFAADTKQGACEVVIKTNEHTHFGFPFQTNIFESIRNLMWHVPMWFTMFALMISSFIFSLRVLAADRKKIAMKDYYIWDMKAGLLASVGIVFCALGLVTGSFWARFTWDAWWTRDPQLNGALAVFLVYIAYLILRRSVDDEDKRARLSAVFNIFAFVLMVILLMILPKFITSLHPGKKGSPAFSSYDLDSSLRTVFYPAVLGFILLGYWFYSLLFRLKKIETSNETH